MQHEKKHDSEQSLAQSDASLLTVLGIAVGVATVVALGDMAQGVSKVQEFLRDGSAVAAESFSVCQYIHLPL